MLRGEGRVCFACRIQDNRLRNKPAHNRLFCTTMAMQEALTDGAICTFDALHAVRRAHTAGPEMRRRV